MSPLFGKVVEATGISRIFAASSVRRACERAGVQPESLTRDELKKAIVYIEEAMRVYLPPEEVPQRLTQLNALLR